jgi:hypothetical protein
MTTPTGRESDKFMLRLPDGMRERIKAAADASNRSMNAEIVATLEEKYPPPIPDEPDSEWQIVYDFMDAIEAAETDEDRARVLAEANAAMAADPALRDMEIRVMRDPFYEEDFVAAVTKRKTD